MRNLSGSHVEEFVLVGFPTSRPFQALLFVFFFAIYLLTLLENVLIVSTIWLTPSLHRPMYFFLGHLSFLELWYINVTIPRLLGAFLTQDGRVSYGGCMTQLYFFIALACTECVLLAVMAYDRYLAICEPLRYPSLMPPRLATRLAAASWGSGFFSSMMKLLFISRLSYCGPNIINHFFCDISPLLNLTCSDKEQAELVDFLLALVMILLPLVAVVSSYAAIIVAILRIPTAQGRHKAFSTCTSHLAVVVIYYSSTLFTYARPRAMYTFNYNKIISVLYTVIVPFLNPAIYCLRNKEVKDAFRKTMLGRCHHPREGPD
ncbi:olfactory receptor 414 [Mus musculus]|uniref:Olfactory receptor n=1 Tax=Mus musculus TaxID=10090 RepID=Q8VG29_MOUSE|nr:Olfactory receptor 414 [Mus musculus]AAI06817.1 Olfactory receptor 414 [Mus musculus]AAL60997.1 olfactory receptor MOR103-10 [Mus musculus]AAP70935.1 olfactory receptor Olfr414 [Mus musculus]EDL13216.1 olfactory receptor 414 [Mus musculus]